MSYLEQRAAVKVCQALGESATETLRKIRRMYGESALSRTSVLRWHKRFAQERNELKDNAHVSQPQVVRTEQKIEVAKQALTDSCQTVDKIAAAVGISPGTCRKILTDDLSILPVNSHSVSQSQCDGFEQRYISVAAKRKVDSQEDSSSEPKKKTQRKNPQRSSRKNEQNEDPLQAEEVMIKTEPVESDDDTSGFETVTVPGCSTWTEESDDEESSESENVLSSDEPKTDAPADGQDVCRLCMSSEKLFGIFDPVSVQLNLASKITDVSAIPIQKGDGLPQLICPPCAAAVQNFYDFKVQCAVTDVTLKAEHKKETLDQIISSKNKSDLTEFQKLNMRLKANLQCFYDIVDAINELQDKTQREVGNFSGIVLKMSTSAVESKDSKGKKRKKATPAWPQILAKQTTSVSETVTSETIPTPTAVPESIVSDAANSNVGVNIKVEPDPDLEMETVPEASFVSQIDDMLVTKLEYEDTFCNSETMSDDPGLPNTDMLSFDESAGRALESFQEGARVSLTTLESVCPTDFRTNEQVPKIDSTYSNGK